MEVVQLNDVNIVRETEGNVNQQVDLRVNKKKGPPTPGEAGGGTARVAGLGGAKLAAMVRLVEAEDVGSLGRLLGESRVAGSGEGPRVDAKRGATLLGGLRDLEGRHDLRRLGGRLLLLALASLGTDETGRVRGVRDRTAALEAGVQRHVQGSPCQCFFFRVARMRAT